MQNLLKNETEYSILSYLEVKQKYPEIFFEKNGSKILKGMTFNKEKPSIFVISTKSSYRDNIKNDCIEYDGTNQPGDKQGEFDQIDRNQYGRLNVNGMFVKKIDYYNSTSGSQVLVQILKKIIKNKWVNLGFYKINNYQYLFDGKRNKYVFYCYPINFDQINLNCNKIKAHQRRIPGQIMQQVFERDEGRCKICGEVEDLQFDHILPYSKGGTSLDANNIQLLCKKHNMEKNDNICYS